MASNESQMAGQLQDTTTGFSALADPRTAACLAQIARVASQKSIEIYLVGGLVREMVAGRSTLPASPDLTVVGHAADFAGTLAERLEDCAVISASQHQTAEVIIGGMTVDIAFRAYRHLRSTGLASADNSCRRHQRRSPAPRLHRQCNGVADLAAWFWEVDRSIRRSHRCEEPDFKGFT